MPPTTGGMRTARAGWSAQAARFSSILDRPVTVEAAVAVALCVLLGTKLSPLPFTPYAGLLGLVIFPVMLSLRRFWGLTWLAALLTLAVVSGILLTLSTTHDTLPTVMIGKSAMLVALIGGVAVVAYARSIVGVAGTATAYGIGMLISTLLSGGSGGWRFTYSIPIAITILALLAFRARFIPQIVGLIALAGIGFVNDSRSNSAMLVLAAVVLTWQRLSQVVSRRRRRVGNVLGIVFFAVGVFQLIQFSLLEGVFGEVTQAKTAYQIKVSGNLLLGGRPEAAASFALVQRYPFGLGSGVVPGNADILAAKSSMLSVGYDPQNNYVDVFMFGNGVEVHSIVGDFWVLFGLAGLAACIAIVAIIVRGLEHALRDATLTGLVAYLTIRTFWDLAFSPPAPSMVTLALTLPLIAVAVPWRLSPPGNGLSLISDVNQRRTIRRTTEPGTS